MHKYITIGRLNIHLYSTWQIKYWRDCNYYQEFYNLSIGYIVLSYRTK